MIDDERLLRIKRDAQAALFRIPGVRAVSVGHKFSGGKNTGQIAIVVDVEKKRPASELPKEQLIPSEINGIPTDVVEWQPQIKTTALINDQSKDRPLPGGSSIIIEFTEINGNIQTTTTNIGTLCCVGKTNGTIPNIPAGGIVGVTCQHVLADTHGNTPVGHKVGQPSTKECSPCCFCCNDIIGKVLFGVMSADVDAAIIALTDGLDYYRAAKGPLGNLNGTRILKPSDVGARVKKYGQTTGFTDGTVLKVDHTVTLGGQVFADGQIVIDPDPATPVWDCCLCSQGHQPCGGGNSENFRAFDCKGDSGAPVFDEDNNLVGMVTAANCSGQGIALGIDIITTAMGITIELESAVEPAPPHKQTVPSVPGINAMANIELGVGAAPLRIPAKQQEQLAAAHRELMETPLGQQFAESVHQHQREVLHLVNTNRRVATVWRRSGGPEIIAAALRMVQFHDEHLPSNVCGLPLGECLARIQRIFERYGSRELIRALREWGPKLNEILGLSYAQLLTALQSGGAE